MNANSGETRRRADFAETRAKRGPADWYLWAQKPAPIRALPREELLRRALACEEGWNQKKELTR